MGKKAGATLRVPPAVATLAVVGLLASTGPPQWAFSEPAASEGSQSTNRRPWQRVLTWLEAERDRFAADLEQARVLLIARAERENPELVQRLTDKPAVPRRTGYGLLPDVEPDRSLQELEPRRQAYSLESLTTVSAANFRDAALLKSRVAEEPTAPLERLIAEYERLQPKLENLDSHINYHSMWQQAAIDDAEFFTRQNRIHARAIEWDQSRANVDPQASDSARMEIAELVATFRPTPGLAIELDASGTRVLRVSVATDITDASFLEKFRRGVLAAFSESEAARARRFRVDLTFDQITPASLYPDGSPETGAAIDKDAHVARFPNGALVLTTGAKRTHAFVGRHIQLGTDPKVPRSLAHEFAHLLGFKDAYLRAFEDSPDDPFGCVFVEWTGLRNDLMGSPSRGPVTVAMIDQLLKAYGPE
jgi:hypothetical protein